jgi:ATP-binding cassette subfamily B protein
MEAGMLGKIITKGNVTDATLITLWHYLPKHRKKQFWLLLVLMIIASILDVISVGSVLPFLGALTAPEQLYQYSMMQPLIQLLQIKDPAQLIFPLTLLFIIAILLAGTVRLILLYVTTKLSFATGADLSIQIYRNTLYQEYSTLMMRNSSELINGIIVKTGTVTGVLMSSFTIVSSIIMIIGIMGILLAVNITVALGVAVGFGLLYWGVIRYTKERVKENSQHIANQSTIMIKSLQEGLGGIRDVLIDSSQQFYCNLYRNADKALRKASANNQFIAGSPHYVMEVIGMTLIVSIAYLLAQQQGGMVTAIPILGALALGAKKILPALQQAYASYTSIKGARASLEDVLQLLNQKLPSYANKSLPVPIPFESNIILKNLSFRYTKETPWVLKNINLTLSKGERIGFIGITGSGKSTLLDIIMGLLSPTTGELIIDQQSIISENRKSWQAHIAHVPQNIYLSDSTIEENIAFAISREEIDHQRVKKAAQQAQIADFIEQMEDGYQTFVGEQGVRLSGGQRQRIGIARALYKNANVLIFDEATSALDNTTEQAVMGAIEGLGKELTILIIAHRLTTLKGCNQIVKLDKNSIIRIGTYQNILNSHM